MYGSQFNQRAAELLFSGEYAWLFWGGVVLLGIIVPLVIEGIQMAGRHVTAARWSAVVIPLLVLAGGLVLRFVVLYAGLESYV